MAQARKPSLVKLIVGIIFTSEGILLKAQKRLTAKFGPIDFESEVIKFDFTDYYTAEMGPDLRRKFISFKKLIKPGALSAIKLCTNRLETRLSAQEKSAARKINLDPGYLCAAKLVLASCKDFSHRIYLKNGVYAEVTMEFRKGKFEFLPWTYPDYKSPQYLAALTAIRQRYLKEA